MYIMLKERNKMIEKWELFEREMIPRQISMIIHVSIAAPWWSTSTSYQLGVEQRRGCWCLEDQPVKSDLIVCVSYRVVGRSTKR